jgi:hypothetical protein
MTGLARPTQRRPEKRERTGTAAQPAPAKSRARNAPHRATPRRANAPSARLLNGCAVRKLEADHGWLGLAGGAPGPARGANWRRMAGAGTEPIVRVLRQWGMGDGQEKSWIVLSGGGYASVSLVVRCGHNSTASSSHGVCWASLAAKGVDRSKASRRLEETQFSASPGPD